MADLSNAKHSAVRSHPIVMCMYILAISNKDAKFYNLSAIRFVIILVLCC